MNFTVVELNRANLSWRMTLFVFLELLYSRKSNVSHICIIYAVIFLVITVKLLWSNLYWVKHHRNIDGLAWLDESDTGGISAANSETSLNATFSQQFREFYLGCFSAFKCCHISHMIRETICPQARQKGGAAPPLSLASGDGHVSDSRPLFVCSLTRA